MTTLTEHKTDNYHYFTDKQGRKQGEFRTWHPNGQLSEQYFFVDSKRHGEYKAWYANGQPWEHSFFVDSKRHGEFRSWHGNGRPMGHYFFVDRERIVNFFEEPDKYPKTPEQRTFFKLTYGSGEWL